MFLSFSIRSQIYASVRTYSIMEYLLMGHIRTNQEGRVWQSTEVAVIL